MRRVLTTALLPALFAAVALAPSASAAGELRLSPTGEEHFPARAYLLSLPSGTSAEPQQVQVDENGSAVRELSVTSPELDATSRGVMLVIDASMSMRGTAIESAMDAARALISHRADGQKIGVVVFHRKATTLLSPTTDQDALEAALSEIPKLGVGTRIYDGVELALDELDKSGVSAGSVVALSDGADTGSRTSSAAVAEHAEKGGVRIFAVSLESDALDADTLAELAEAGGGEYTAAASESDLEAIYDGLGDRFANEYLVRYRSLEGLSTKIRVDVTVDGVGSTAFDYTSPKLAIISGAQDPTTNDGFWGSALAVVLVSFGSAFIACFGVVGFIAYRRRSRELERRVGAFTPTPQQAKYGEVPTAQSGLLSRIEENLEGRDWWESFKLECDVARIKRPAVQVAALTAAGTVLAFWIFYSMTRSPIGALFCALVPTFAVIAVRTKASRQRAAFRDQLADNLQVLSSAMRAGQSFIGALAVAVDDAPEPARTELGRVVTEEQIGVPLSDSLGKVVKRMQNPDLEQVVLVAMLQRDAGGNTAEVLDRVAETIRERAALRRLISSLTAQGRMARWIVSLIPVVLLLLISSINPEYMAPIFKETAGIVILCIAAVLVVVGSLVIKKIVSIKV
jgi:tight adherence protein B